MPHTTSPYDRHGSGFLEEGPAPAFMAVALSFGFHVLLAWVFIIGLPLLASQKRESVSDVIVVELFGDLTPPAPPAPADLPVDPEQRGPDVVERTRTDPLPTPQPQITPPTPETVTVPPDVIPLAKKAPERPPEITKKSTPPPVKAPRVETEQDKKRKAAASEEAKIAKKMEELKRKRAAENLDESIDSRMMNLASNHRGSADGEGSQSGGSSGGQRVHPEMQRYYAHIRDIIKDKWVPPPGTISNELSAVYRVTIQPDGSISAMTLERSSGHADYDLSVERAIRLSSPLPPLPPIFENRPVTVGLRFSPKDLR